jgi:hypothetical protein
MRLPRHALYCASYAADETANGHLVINPKTLNLKSKGRVITTFVELSTSFNPADIDVASLLLEGAVLPTPKLGNGDEDGTPDLMVKFSRQALIALFCETDGDKETVGLWVMENVAGDLFEVRGTVRVQGQCP